MRPSSLPPGASTCTRSASAWGFSRPCAATADPACTRCAHQTRGIVRDQVLKERNGVLWPDFDDQALFELDVERCLLTRTHAADGFPQGATVWRV